MNVFTRKNAHFARSPFPHKVHLNIIKERVTAILGKANANNKMFRKRYSSFGMHEQAAYRR